MVLKHLAFQYQVNTDAIALNLTDVTDEQSLMQYEHSSGINWHLGHVCNYRNRVLRLLGAETIEREALTELYDRGLKFDPEETYWTVKRLTSFLYDTNATIQAKLIDDDFCSNLDNRIIKKLHFLLFHEAYHNGEIAVLRRLLGHKGAIQ